MAHKNTEKVEKVIPVEEMIPVELKILEVWEINELASLLTKSVVSRQLEPEQAKRMGALRERAGAVGKNLKIENHTCKSCKQPYVTVEGTTMIDCPNPNCRKK